MRKLFALMLFLCIPSLFSLDKEHLTGTYRYAPSGPFYQMVTFTDSSLSLEIVDESLEEPIIRKVESRYSIEHDQGIDYLRIEETGEKWLILFHEDFLFLYDSEGIPFFEGENISQREVAIEYLGTYEEPAFLFDSMLIESTKRGEISYPSENLTKDGAIPFPWVEGEDMYGVGVKAESELRKITEYSEVYLFISNGYVSYHRPDLYLKNSRVKTLSIKNLDSGDEIIINIDDTPHFQTLNFSSIVKTEFNKFELTILDVYKGNKYEDTCINMLPFYMTIGVPVKTQKDD